MIFALLLRRYIMRVMSVTISECIAYERFVQSHSIQIAHTVQLSNSSLSYFHHLQ
jgi:hypothetical protein